MLETNGYSLDEEKAQREKESEDGTDEILKVRVTKNAAKSENNGAGRPEKDDSDKTSDPENTERGKEPKPSSPEGSMDNSG